MIFVGNKYEARDKSVFELEFHCETCQLETTGRVLGIGEGAAVSPYFLSNSDAAFEARSRAHRNAADEAALTITVAHCPRCGVRNPSAVRRFFAKAIFWPTLALSAGLGTGWFFATAAREPLFWLGFSAIGAVFAGLSIHRRRRSWIGSWERVEFPRTGRRQSERRSSTPPS